MLHISFLSSRAAAFVLAILSILAFAGDAQAQSAACSRLLDNLRTFDRNSDFRDVERNSRETRALENELQTAESRYIRNGCSDMVRNGEQLTRQCLSLARTITEGRAELEDLRESVGTGNAVAQQREALLQEISRFGCRTDSRASIDDDGGRGGLFDRMFGGYTDEEQFDDGDLMLEDFAGYGGYSTVRTVCVRACDGYYWPVSYSTLTDYAYQDAQQCQAQCPGTPVDLYYYSNPGQNPEQMVSLSGEPYTALPNAFRYRETFDPSCSCKAPVNLGNISIVSQSGGQSRAVIDFSGATFPLPLRDPRGQPGPTPTPEVVEPVTVAEVINVPLPRRRPTAPGETPAEQPVPVEDGSDQMRLVQFGDRTVRIVGPDTPYGQPAAAGT